MKIIFLSFSLFTLLLFSQIDVLACSCPSLPQTLEQEVKGRVDSSQAVFSGEVLEINKIPQSRNVSVKIKVAEVWKGIFSKELTVTTPDHPGSCGYPFQAGKSYLVFARGSDKNNLTTGLCLRNSELGKANEELKILELAKANEEKIFALIPAHFRKRLIERYRLLGEYERGEQPGKIYDLWLGSFSKGGETISKNTSKKWFPEGRVEFVAESVTKAPKGIPSGIYQADYQIEGYAKLMRTTCFVKRSATIFAFLRNGEWYFSGYLIELPVTHAPPEPCITEKENQE